MFKNGMNYGEENVALPNHGNFGRHFVEHILRYEEKFALINGSTGEKMTHGELAQHAVNVASSLRLLGVMRGEVVAICSENRFEFMVTAIASVSIGAVATFINSAYSHDEVLHTMDISKPSYLFLSPTTYKNYYEIFKNINTLKIIFLFGEEVIDTNVIPYKDLTKVDVDINSFEFLDFKGSTETALILYSSGTTGPPKGVKLNHKNIIVSITRQPSTGKDLSIFVVAPWCNTIGIMVSLNNVYNGISVVHMNTRFNLKVYLEIIEKFRVGSLLAVPSLIIILCKSSLLETTDVSSVRIIYSGGAPLTNDTIEDAKKSFPNLTNVLQGYGMTETAGPITEDNTDPRQGSVGQVVSGIVIKIVNVETREKLGPNQPGEVCVKGLVLFDGFIGKNKEDYLDDEGFYATGDVAYYDENGYYYIVDRLKEIIKYKAYQVSPSEIEAVLFQHPAVKDAAVLAIPDYLAGELPAAVLVKNSEHTVSEQEILEFEKSKVSPWKYLRGGVRFVNGIPKTASGKIIRRQLLDLFQDIPASKMQSPQ